MVSNFTQNIRYHFRIVCPACIVLITRYGRTLSNEQLAATWRQRQTQTPPTSTNLPANNKLWYEMTHRLGDGRNPMEAISFLTWASIHDYQLGQALTVPLFEIGHFTHTWSFPFEAHHICMAQGAPQIKMPMIVRSLKLSCMFLASKILQVSLKHTYPTNANPDGHVFLPMSNKEVKSQSFATDLLLNPSQVVHSGWTDAMFHTYFSSEHSVNRFCDKLTSLKTGSVFHLSRPKTGISSQIWHD